MKIKRASILHFLTVYSGVLTLALGVIVFTGARGPRKASFDELTVQRINVIEPDGTLRLVIANNARFPGTPIRGREVPRPDRTNMGGMIYMDDEGTEIGGFTWGGKKKDGKADAFGHLSFDRYNGDENLALTTWEKDGKMETGLVVSDSWSGEAALAEPERIRALPADQQEAAWKKWKEIYPSRQRIVLARIRDQSVIHAMADSQGRHRLVMKVAQDGTPSIELLDAEGKVTTRIPQARP